MSEDWWNWAAVAVGIAALDVILGRRSLPLLSHTWWEGLDRPASRYIQTAVWTAVTVHLMRRRRWPAAFKTGLAIATGDALARRYRDCQDV